MLWQEARFRVSAGQRYQWFKQRRIDEQTIWMDRHRGTKRPSGQPIAEVENRRGDTWWSAPIAAASTSGPQVRKLLSRV